MFKPSGPYWSDDELAKCRELLLAGKSDEEIAEALNRTPGAITRKRYSLTYHLRTKIKSETASGHPRDVGMDCRRHLIDLMRSYGATTLGEAKALYRQRNELDVPEGYTYRSVAPTIEVKSYTGSHFADVPR